MHKVTHDNSSVTQIYTLCGINTVLTRDRAPYSTRPCHVTLSTFHLLPFNLFSFPRRLNIYPRVFLAVRCHHTSHSTSSHLFSHLPPLCLVRCSCLSTWSCTEPPSSRPRTRSPKPAGEPCLRVGGRGVCCRKESEHEYHLHARAQIPLCGHTQSRTRLHTNAQARRRFVLMIPVHVLTREVCARAGPAGRAAKADRVANRAIRPPPKHLEESELRRPGPAR